MESNDYLKDISEIKDLMNRSSRFISLSGLSGIMAGIYAHVGAYLAYCIIYVKQSPSDDHRTLVIQDSDMTRLFIIAFSVIALSVITAIVLSWQKAKIRSEKLWDTVSKRMVINFLIPLVTGGLVVFFMILKGGVLAYTAPLTLIFYGLALINASKYTLGDVRYLGLATIVLGLFSAWFLNYGLFFWAGGFGICHIIYGSLIYLKYDKKK